MYLAYCTSYKRNLATLENVSLLIRLQQFLQFGIFGILIKGLFKGLSNYSSATLDYK